MPRRKVDIVIENRPSKDDSNSEDDEPKMKMKRWSFYLPLPERPRVVGRALVCGQGDVGQLGLGDDERKYECKRPALVWQVANVVDVVAGGMHNLVLTHDGRVFTFGCNDEGVLGRDTTEEGSEFEPRPTDLPGRALKISAGDSHSACLLEDGRVFAWGSFRDSHGNMGLTLEGNKRYPFDVLPGMTCCDIASGADHLVILTRLGKVFTVGCGEQGQLGRVSLRSATGEGRRGKTELLKPGQVIIKRAKPIEAIWATNYCTFLRESQTGAIWAFGLNNYKQLIYAKNMEYIIKPKKLNIDDVKQIAGGQHHTLLLKMNGTVYTIGRSHYGRLGLGVLNDDVNELTAIPAFKDKFVVNVSCGEVTSFAITQDGKLYAWGMGSNYQLGTGTDDDVIEPKLIVSKETEGKRIIKASSGGQHSIFLVENELQPANVSKNDTAILNGSKNNSVTDAINDTNREEEEDVVRSAMVNEKKEQQQQLKDNDNKQLKNTINKNINNNNNSNSKNSNKSNKRNNNNTTGKGSTVTSSIIIANSQHVNGPKATSSKQNNKEASSKKELAATGRAVTVAGATTAAATALIDTDAHADIEDAIQPPPVKRGRKKLA